MATAQTSDHDALRSPEFDGACLVMDSAVIEIEDNVTVAARRCHADGVDVLDVRDLHIELAADARPTRFVNGVSFSVAEGETIAIVGESGSGKSVTAHALMGRIPADAEISGQILFQGTDLLTREAKDRRALRGTDIAMILQDSSTSLNPLYSVGWQVAEGMRRRRGVTRKTARAEAIDLLERVGIPAPSQRYDMYPHEMSGGMRQRVAIAMALSLRPALLLADEPTTALDVTVQAQIIELIKDLQNEFGMALVLISHDLAVVSEVADKIVVMYAGNLMEAGAVSDVLAHPANPYTRALLDSNPDAVESISELHAIAGSIPPLNRLPSGCVFHPRCQRAEAVCSATIPTLAELPHDHVSACHFAERSK